jgi:hypothetical protein
VFHKRGGDAGFVHPAFGNTLRQTFKGKGAGGDAVTVEFEKDQSRFKSRPFVSINKRMSRFSGKWTTGDFRM